MLMSFLADTVSESDSYEKQFVILLLFLTSFTISITATAAAANTAKDLIIISVIV